MLFVWSCRYETLIALLESNELGTVSEFNVFLAAMRWVDADKAREQLLDEVLGLIRFPTMDYEELGLVGKHPTAAGAPILKVGSVDESPSSHPCLPLPTPPFLSTFQAPPRRMARTPLQQGPHLQGGPYCSAPIFALHHSCLTLLLD